MRYFPPAIIPPSLVDATELIISLYFPPITFAHSISPFALYFISIPSDSPEFLFVKVTPFSKSILLESKYPPTITPPSFVSAIDSI